MGYFSQVFFMIDSDAPYLLGDKVRAFAANLNHQDPNVRLLDRMPIFGGHGLGTTRSNNGTGFLIPYPGWKWYDGYPEPTWLNQLMDFMDSRGLEKYYHFVCMGEDYEPYTQGGTIRLEYDEEDQIEVRGQLECRGLSWAPTIIYDPN